MKKKLTKGVSMFLVCLLVFSMLPGQLVASAVEAAEGAYTLLCEPKISGGFEDETYGNVAAVWEKIYYDPVSGQTFAGIKSNKDKGAWKPMHLLAADSSGVHAVSDWYQKVTGLSAGGFAAAQNFDGKWGIIDSTGRVIVDFKYDVACMPNDNGYTLVREDSLSTRNEYIVDLTSGTMYNTSSFASENGFILSTSGGTFWLRDKDLYQKYSAVSITANGYTIVEDSKSGRDTMSRMVADKNGEIILSDLGKDYTIGNHWSSLIDQVVSKEGLIRVRNGSREGYVNLEGKIVIPMEYSSARDFCNGYAVVSGGMAGNHLIDMNGNVITPLSPYYSYMSNASNTGVTWAGSYESITAVYQVEARGSKESPASGPDNNITSASEDEYIYNTTDPGEDTKMDADRLNRVTDPTSAAEAVRNMVNGMTQAQKDSPTGIDLATLYAETAVARAASKPFMGNDVLINDAAIADLEAEAAQALAAVETALVNGGIATARYLSSTITLTTSVTNEISIRIDPDILTTSVDKVRVEGPNYALTFNITELEEDLTDLLTFHAEPVNTSGVALASGNTAAPLTATLLVNRTTDAELFYLANTGANAVKVTLPGGSTTNPVTVSLPKDNSKDTTYQAIVNVTGTATSSKYNPATTAVDGKVNTSGTYTVTTKEVNFTDIASKSAEMQSAIKYLASRGIISGTGGTNYSPNASISRAEISALLVRALGKLNSSATNSFTDVKSSDWYYTAAGSSQKAGYISGFEDNTFRGANPINKEQIVVVAARVLISDMKYKTPSNTATYLGKYSDTVASWAQPQVALATKENLVVYRTDGTFSGAKNMTRGDAAIIIYRLFKKIW